MSQKSLIYRNIHIYRFIMQGLYKGSYRKRFRPITDMLTNLPAQSRILELCFGDTQIAEFCRKQGLGWKGIDLNENFVQHAKKSGYDASRADLTTVGAFPSAQVCLMIGSLYHFHNRGMEFIQKMFDAAPVVILSEPVKNLSSNQGLIGFFAKRAANAGKGNEIFRYDETSFQKLLEKITKELNCQLISNQLQGRDCIVKLIKNDRLGH